MRRNKQGSSKRKRSSSRELDSEGEDLLVRILNERATSDRHVLIAQDKLDELRSYKDLLRKTTIKANEQETRLAELMLDHERSLSVDTPTLKPEHPPEIPAQLYKELISAYKLLEKYGKRLEEEQLRPNVKQKLRDDIKNIGKTSKELIRTLKMHPPGRDLKRENAEIKREIETLKESEWTILQYKETLEKMRAQTHQLKEKLEQLESGSQLKTSIEEEENKIKILSEENRHLNEHVETLKASLTEESAVIDHLKVIVGSLSLRNPQSMVSSPSIESSARYFSPRPNPRELELQEEIEALDVEILELQESLFKALAA